MKMQIWIVAFVFISNIFLTACATTQANTPQAQMPSHSVAATITQLEDPAPITTDVELAATEEQLEPIVIKKKPQVAKKVIPQDTPSQPIATAPQPTLAPAPAPANTNWKPNEVHLIRGSELVNALQLNLGRKPTIAEMQQLLQTHMGLSPDQAQQIATSLK